MMNFKEIFLVISFWFQLIIVIECTTEQQCYDQIYGQCTHETTFTTKEIQTTQLYLQRRLSTTSPIRAKCPISANNPPCIRKDIKCLSPEEIQNLTSAWVQLYSKGVIANYSKIHNDYWGATHKFTPAFRWHYEFINRFERELQKINPAICMPYWNFYQDFAHPELSVVWDIFGRAGNASNDYCVPDGPFANITCTFPSAHCLRRQWRLNNTLYAWKGPEWYTAIQQMHLNPTFLLPTITTQITNEFTPQMIATFDNELSVLPLLLNPTLTPYGQRILLFGITSHFDTHLSTGGWSGDMSVPFAPNDPLFYLLHIRFECDDLLWQLSNCDDIYLLPQTYTGGMSYDNVTSSRYFTNIQTDTYNYYDDVYVKEGFQFGYGQMCHLYDVIIKPINYIVNQNLLLEAKLGSLLGLLGPLYTCVPDLSAPLPTLPSTATLTIKIRPLCNPPPLSPVLQRLKQSLGPILFAKYYPNAESNNWCFRNDLFENISPDCNPVSDTCKPMPRAQPFSATSEGQRQYQAFTADVADFDETSIVDAGQSVYDQFMDDLANSGYCSPYV